MQANSGTGVFSSAHARMALRWCSSVDNEQAGFSAHDGGELNFKDCVSVADAIGVVVATGSSASLDKCELRWSKGVGKLARDADTFLTMTACDVSGCALEGVRATEHATVHLEDCQVQGCEGVGLRADGKDARLHMRKCVVWQIGLDSVQVTSSARVGLWLCRLKGSNLVAPHYRKCRIQETTGPL
jgi:hypothetical protein